MSQLSGPEIKHTLRKLEFPLCAKEALTKIGQLLISNRTPTLKHMDLALDLMAELVFCEVDRRGNKRPSPLTSIDELQLIDALYDYFNSTANETSRNSVFLSLFSGTTAMMRLGVLSKLVSIAVGVPSPPILISASTWMQQLGNTSPNSIQLAKALVRDYFILAPNTVPKLKILPKIAPQFVANFLTAVANIYFCDGKKDLFTFPPQCLLETITFWIKENPGLCIAAQQMQPSLPQGAIAMEATTPFAGLLKWCILASIYNQDFDLYGQLHLGLISSILEIPVLTTPRAISAQHLVVPAGSIHRYALETHSKLKRGEGGDRQKLFKEDQTLQLCLDRFAQAVQVALSVKCVYGNIEDLFTQLQQLPQNRLLHIVIGTHKQNK
ncbi:hypothetical protein ILUMI_02870 [Ignelater luminosus]|uniref:Uncharacterized protein n=1 Tax=Ignelater luminosus TaxID=2038154 RepID=A0A8K0DHD6_IGNLU|nr:hypothetical protein ILUMI_02870 [Ignelater luminosus]